jgi:hypothetical protein
LNLTPEQITVLRMIDEDGIEAQLTAEQRVIRDQLEDANYIYIIGDEYDADYYLSDQGKLALDPPPD